MKNKLLYALICVVFVFAIVGCGTQENDVTEKKDKNVSDKKSDSNKEKEKNATISSILQGFADGNDEAVIKFPDDVDKYYVIDKDGKVKYNFEEDKLSKTSNYVYRNGYFVLNYVENKNEASENDLNYVKDLKSGKVLFTGDSKTRYVDVTDDGYILVNVKEDNLAGEKYYSRIIDKDGKVIWENENKYSRVEYFQVITNNIVLFSPYSYDNYKIINAKTGEEKDLGLNGLASYVDVSINGNNILYGISANNDKYQIINSTTGEVTKTGLSHIKQILNDKYVFATPLWGTVGIYDYNGNLVKDLTEGEVNQIIYYKDNYYIISKTGFFYILDDSFKYVKEPEKIVGDTKKLKFTSFGIELSTDGSENLTYIPYEDFKANEEFDKQSKKIDGILTENNSKYGFIRSSSSLTEYKLVNLNNFKEISIEK